MREVRNSGGYHVPVEGAFTQSVRVPPGTGLLFVSGITARDEHGVIQAVGDIREQTHTVLRQMARILAESGASMHDVVKITTFVRNADDIPLINEIRKQHFGTPPPASSTVEVSRLFDPDQLIEIEAVVTLPD